jgi:hypothetical protein
MFLFMKTESMDSYMATHTLTKRVFKLIQNNTGKRIEIRKVPKRTPSDNEVKYRIIRKSLRDFRSLRYSSWDGHAGREHVKRSRVTPSFCPTLQMLDMSTLGQSSQKFLAPARQSRLMTPAGLLVSQRTGSHSDVISRTTHELLCP